MLKYPSITADSPILKCLNADLEMLMKDLHAFAQLELRITLQTRPQQQQVQANFWQDPQGIFQPVLPRKKSPHQPHFEQQKPKQTMQPQEQDEEPRVLYVQGPNDCFGLTPETLWLYQQRCALLSQQQCYQQLQQVQRENQTQHEEPRVLYVQGPNDCFGLTQQQPQVPQQLNPQVLMMNQTQQVMNQPIQGIEHPQAQLSGMQFRNHL